MLTIARLFGKSPFAPLQTHMDLIAGCIAQLPGLFEAWLSGRKAAVDAAAEKISHLEREADLTKEGIRIHLPKSLFLPVDRSALLEILSIQEQIAEQAEAIAHHATIEGMTLPAPLQPSFQLLVQKNIETFWRAQQVIKELDGLLESAFGGLEAEKVRGMIEQIALLEHDAASTLRTLKKQLYATQLPYQTFHWTMHFIEAIGGLSQLSERLGGRVRLLLELK